MEVSAPIETFCQRVVAAASIRPDKVAMTLIEAAGQESVTFGSMLDQLRSIAYRLTQEGIGFGDRVALIGENHPNWAIAYLGIIYRGAVVTPMDPAATTQALAAFRKGSEAKLAFVSPDSLDKFRAACEELGSNIPAVALLPLAQRNGLGTFEDWVRTPTSQEFNDAQPKKAGRTRNESDRAQRSRSNASGFGCRTCRCRRCKTTLSRRNGDKPADESGN